MYADILCLRENKGHRRGIEGALKGHQSPSEARNSKQEQEQDSEQEQESEDRGVQGGKGKTTAPDQPEPAEPVPARSAEPAQPPLRRMPLCFRQVKHEPLNLPKPEPPQPQPALALVTAPSASVPAAVGKPAKSKRACRLPDDWRLPMAWGQWAVGLGVPEETVRREAEKFADYRHAKAGVNATKLDWQATWRNWIRRACEQGSGGTRAASSRPQRSTAEDYLRVVQEIHERNRPYLTEEGNTDAQRQMA